MPYFRKVNDRLRTHARAFYSNLDEQLQVVTRSFFERRGFVGAELERRVADETPSSLSGLETMVQRLYDSGGHLMRGDLGPRRLRIMSEAHGKLMAEAAITKVIGIHGSEVRRTSGRAQRQAVDDLLQELAEAARDFDPTVTAEMPNCNRHVRGGWNRHFTDVFEAITAEQPKKTGLRGFFGKVAASNIVAVLDQLSKSSAQAQLAESAEDLEQAHILETLPDVMESVEDLATQYRDQLERLSELATYQPVVAVSIEGDFLDLDAFDQQSRLASGQGLVSVYELSASTDAAAVPHQRVRATSPMVTFDAAELSVRGAIETMGTQPIPVIPAPRSAGHSISLV